MSTDPSLAAEFANHLSRLDQASSGSDLSSTRNEIERLMARPDVTSEIIARAITITLSNVNPNFIPGKVGIANAYLQRKLTEEHVAAQGRMTKAAEDLQKAALKVANASWAIAVASLIVTCAALYVAVVNP